MQNRKANPGNSILLCNLECVLMPNGEIISHGKSIGYYKEFKDHLYRKPKVTNHEHDELVKIDSVFFKIEIIVEWGESISYDNIKKKIVEYQRNVKAGIEYPPENILINNIVYRADYCIEVEYLFRKKS